MVPMLMFEKHPRSRRGRGDGIFEQVIKGAIVLSLLALLAACGGGATSGPINPTTASTAANARLSSLTLSCGNLDPSCNNLTLSLGGGKLYGTPGYLAAGDIFSGGKPISDYVSTQAPAVNHITVQAIAVNNLATVKVNDQPPIAQQASLDLPLQYGDNTFTIVVTSANRANQRTYTITVTRLTPTDLTSLKVAAANSANTFPLTPAFSHSTTAYTLTIAATVTKIQVIPVAADPQATILVQGLPTKSGSASAAIEPVVGDTPIDVKVTAPDGSTKTYQIVLTRLGSADVIALTLTGQPVAQQGVPIDLDSAFQSTTTTYTAHVENRFDTITIDATKAAPAAVMKVTLDGSSIGTPIDNVSSPILLPQLTEGQHELVIAVSYAPTNDARSYHLTLIRQPPPQFAWEAYLKPSGAGALKFGTAVALSADGTTMAVGAPNEGSGGAVHVFARDGAGAWQEQATSPLTGGAGEAFGTSVALSGDGLTLAVGAPSTGIAPGPGAVYVFTQASGWSQQSVVAPFRAVSGQDFGQSVALSADGLVLAVGLPADSTGLSSTNTGISTGIYSPAQAKTTPDGDRSFISSGAVSIFRWDGTSWAGEAFIKVPTPTYFLVFGQSVALSYNGALLAVGAPGESVSSTAGAGSGGVYLYAGSPATWTPGGHLTAANPQGNDNFGSSVALSKDGGVLAVGEPGQDSASTGVGASDAVGVIRAGDSGAVTLFAGTGGTYAQQSFIKASNSRSGFRFGAAVALSAAGDGLVVGAPGENSAATTIDGSQVNAADPSAGAAYAFSFDSTATTPGWTQTGYIKPPNTQSYGGFGTSVAWSWPSSVSATNIDSALTAATSSLSTAGISFTGTAAGGDLVFSKGDGTAFDIVIVNESGAGGFAGFPTGTTTVNNGTAAVPSNSGPSGAFTAVTLAPGQHYTLTVGGVAVYGSVGPFPAGAWNAAGNWIAVGATGEASATSSIITAPLLPPNDTSASGRGAAYTFCPLQTGAAACH